MKKKKKKKKIKYRKNKISLSFPPASEATPVGGAEQLVIRRPGWHEVLLDIRQRQKHTKWKFKLLLS